MLLEINSIYQFISENNYNEQNLDIENWILIKFEAFEAVPFERHFLIFNPFSLKSSCVSVFPEEVLFMTFFRMEAIRSILNP